ncbi:MAG: hypothetical protein KDB68_09705 [Planctomycetes bacterium]|nr:hypothetical protein [Planctomycetota bacterium]
MAVIVVVATSGGSGTATTIPAGSPEAGGSDRVQSQATTETKRAGGTSTTPQPSSAQKTPIIWFFGVGDGKVVPFDIDNPEEGAKAAVAEVLKPYARAGLSKEDLAEMARSFKEPTMGYVQACQDCEAAIQAHIKKHPEHATLVPAVRASINMYGINGGALGLQTVGITAIESTFAAEARAADAEKIAKKYGG